MAEIRQCSLCGGTCAPDLHITFKDSGSKAGGRENDRRADPVSLRYDLQVVKAR